MQIAISTGSLDLSTPQALIRAKALGFAAVEVNLQQAEFGYDYRRKPAARFYRQLRAQLDELGLRVWSTTALSLTQEQMFFERARKDILVGSAVAAGILGSRVLVVQPAAVFTSEIAFNSYLNDGLAPPVTEGFDEAWVQAANRQVTMAMVNVDYWIGIPLTNQVERMSKVSDDLATGWALDVRAALRRGTLARWLARLEPRLAVAYAYDWDEAGNVQAPRAGDWPAILAELGQTRLKALVVHAAPGQTDTEIGESYRFLQRLLPGSD